jgi:hypothetical protein
MTGFQKYQLNTNQIIELLLKTVGQGNEIRFLQYKLLGAIDFYKNNKQVSMVTSPRVFKTVFDSRRLVIYNTNDTILYTMPFNNVSEAMLTRSILNSVSTGKYSSDYTLKSTFVTNTSNKLEVINYFVRLCCEFFK